MPKKMPLGDLGVENQAVNKFLDLMARLIAQRHMQFAHESSTEAPRRPARAEHRRFGFGRQRAAVNSSGRGTSAGTGSICLFHLVQLIETSIWRSICGQKTSPYLFSPRARLNTERTRKLAPRSRLERQSIRDGSRRWRNTFGAWQDCDRPAERRSAALGCNCFSSEGQSSMAAGGTR